MRHLTDRNKHAIRVARVLAIGGLLAFAACQDAVAPEKAKDPVPGGPMLARNSQTALQLLGVALPASTDMYVAAVTDAATKNRIAAFIKTLRNDLLNNAAAAVTKDVATARTSIAAVTDPAYKDDLAAASVALDQIALVLTLK